MAQVAEPRIQRGSQASPCGLQLRVRSPRTNAIREPINQRRTGTPRHIAMPAVVSISDDHHNKKPL
jgi:hypothetical protein